MSNKLPPTKFATLGETLLRLYERDPRAALKREYRLNDAQADYIHGALRQAATVLKEAAAKEAVIRALIEDTDE